MSQDRHLILYHSPRSRSRGARMLFEELGADYELHAFDLTTGQHKTPEFPAINPLGKVPTLYHGDAVITEQVAVHLYAAGLYPEAGLSPAVGDSLRGTYLRWMAFYGACFEPVIVDRSMKHEPAAYSMSPYGNFDTMPGTLTAQLEKGPYLLGERFITADVLWGTALGWITMFKLIPETPLVRGYIDRIMTRPAMQHAQAADVTLAEAQDKTKTEATNAAPAP